MLGDIVPAIQVIVNRIVNHDRQRPTTHPVGLGIENDAHYCVHSYIKTSISGPALQEAYHKAFLHVGGKLAYGQSKYEGDIVADTTKFMAVLPVAAPM